MSLHGELVSPLNIPAWRDFPLRARLAELTGLPTFVDNDAKALALAEGWKGAAAGVRQLPRPWWCRPASGAASCSTAGCSTGPGATPATSATSSSFPAGGAAPAAARGCLEAEASGTSIAAITGRPSAEAGPDIIARTGRLVGQAVASVANLLDLRLAVVAGSVALGYGEPFFDAAQAELDALARLGYSRGARIRPGGLGADGPLIGGAAVGLRGIGRLSA